jgi:hypothetical protein
VRAAKRTTFLGRVKTAFDAEHKFEEFVRSADVRGRLLAMAEPDMWEAATGPRPPGIDVFHRALTKRLTARDQALLWMTALLFGPVVFVALALLPLALVALLVARSFDNFVQRHLYGRDIARRQHESWQAWEHRVAGARGLPIIVAEARISASGACDIHCVGPPNVAGLPLADAIPAVGAPHRGSMPSERASFDLKVWAFTATGAATTLAGIVAWLAVRFSWVRRALALLTAACMCRIAWRRVRVAATARRGPSSRS